MKRARLPAALGCLLACTLANPVAAADLAPPHDEPCDLPTSPVGEDCTIPIQTGGGGYALQSKMIGPELLDFGLRHTQHSFKFEPHVLVDTSGKRGTFHSDVVEYRLESTNAGSGLPAYFVSLGVDEDAGTRTVTLSISAGNDANWSVADPGAVSRPVLVAQPLSVEVARDPGEDIDRSMVEVQLGTQNGVLSAHVLNLDKETDYSVSVVLPDTGYVPTRMRIGVLSGDPITEGMLAQFTFPQRP